MKFRRTNISAHSKLQIFNSAGFVMKTFVNIQYSIEGLDWLRITLNRKWSFSRPGVVSIAQEKNSTKIF